MIDKNNFLESMFTGFGTGIGLDIYEESERLIVNPDKILTTKLDVEDTKNVVKIVDGIYNKKMDISFMQGKTIDDFIIKWKENHSKTIHQFKDFTKNVMREFFNYDIPDPEHIENVYDYRMAIQDSYLEIYNRSLDKDIIKRFESFNKNRTLHRHLEFEKTDIDMRYDKRKNRLVDVLSSRAKSCDSSIDKICDTKITNLWEKIKISRRNGKKIEINYGDIFLKDCLGLLAVVPNVKKDYISKILKKFNLLTLETETKRNDGYRKKTLAMNSNGTIYEIRIYDMKGWVNHYFENPEKRKGIKSHILYKSHKRHDAFQKDPKNQEIIEKISEELSDILPKHCNATIKETLPETYSSKEIDGKKKFRDNITNEAVERIKNYTRHPNSRLGGGIKNINNYINEVMKCYSLSLDDIYDSDIEDIFGKDAHLFNRKIKDVKDGSEKINNIYKTITGKYYKSSEFNNYNNRLKDLGDLIMDNSEGINLKKIIKENPEKVVLHYHAILEKLNKKYKANDNKLVVQTKFNFYKGLLQSYEAFVEKEMAKNNLSNVKSIKEQHKIIRKNFDNFTTENLLYLTEKQAFEEHAELIKINPLLN